jgi:hypothetical protein
MCVFHIINPGIWQIFEMHYAGVSIRTLLEQKTNVNMTEQDWMLVTSALTMMLLRSEVSVGADYRDLHAGNVLVEETRCVI